MIGIQSKNRQTCVLRDKQPCQRNYKALLTAQKTSGVTIHVLYGLYRKDEPLI